MNESLTIIIIAAVTKNRVIGKKGSIPWNIKEELQHFKQTTYGFPIIMGRKTYESIGKTLEGRLNIVLSNKLLWKQKENLFITHDLDEALNICQKQGFSKVFIIGGEKVYARTLSIADKLIISRIHMDIEGDTLFPEYDETIWNLSSIEKRNEFNIETYIRKQS